MRDTLLATHGETRNEACNPSEGAERKASASVVEDDRCSGRPFSIREAASRCGVSAKIVRHYESLGLSPKVDCTHAGYRQYGPNEVHALRVIRYARELGFSKVEIAALLKLGQKRRRASAEV